MWKLENMKNMETEEIWKYEGHGGMKNKECGPVKILENMRSMTNTKNIENRGI